MNVVKIILVLGLGYVAMTQKVEKTRNMLLVVTGLLAFCMFSVEGFDSITFTGSGGTIGGGGIVTAQGVVTGDNGATYTFPVGFNVAGGQLEASNWTCPSGKTPKPLTPSALSTARAAIAGALDNTNIDSVFPCATVCPATAPSPHRCGTGNKYKTSPTGSSYIGDIGEGDYMANCCETDTTTGTGSGSGTGSGTGSGSGSGTGTGSGTGSGSGDTGGLYLKDCGSKSCAFWNDTKDGEKCQNNVFFPDSYCDTE